jgi:hypothetical protein
VLLVSATPPTTLHQQIDRFISISVRASARCLNRVVLIHFLSLGPRRLTLSLWKTRNNNAIDRSDDAVVKESMI